MRHSGALRNFASTVEELARRGHRIHLTFMMQDKLRDERLLEELTGAYPTITHGFGEASRRPWLRLARRIRSAADYARYRAPEYASATALHDRAAARVSPAMQRMVRLPLVRTPFGLRLLTRLLHAVERAIPADDRHRRADRTGGARCRAGHAAHRARLGPGGVCEGGSGGGRGLRSVRPQLGQPDEQRVDSRDPRPRVRLERGTAAERPSACISCLRNAWSSLARRSTTSGSRADRARHATSSARKSACRRGGRIFSICARRSSSRRAKPRSSSGGFRRCDRLAMPACVRRQSWCARILEATIAG